MSKFKIMVGGLFAVAAILSGCEQTGSSSVTGQVTIGEISGNTISVPQSSSQAVSHVSGQPESMSGAPVISSTPSATSSILSSSKAASSVASTTSAATGAVSTTNWNLILVNKKNKLPEGYKPELVEVSGGKFDKRIADAMKNMLAAAKKDGVALSIVSSYHTPERQVEKYNARVNELVATGMSKSEAEAEAAKYIAPPGTSEHCTGLAADIVSPDWYSKHSSLTEDFDQTEQFQWLSTHCHLYGFILRYPKNKEDITMINYEPWHYRYVGVEAATEIMTKGITLEEYLGKQ